MGAEGTATPSPARVAASPRLCPCCWPRGRAPSLGTCPWCRPCCPPALGWPGASGFPSTGLHPRFGETLGIKSGCQTRSVPPASVSLAVTRRDLIAVSYFLCTCSLFSPRKRLIAPAERLVLRARRWHRSPGTPCGGTGGSASPPPVIQSPQGRKPNPSQGEALLWTSPVGSGVHGAAGALADPTGDSKRSRCSSRLLLEEVAGPILSPRGCSG